MDGMVVRRASTPEDLAAAQALRLQVFVREQGVPQELELDGLDDSAIHAVAVWAGEIIGTGRLLRLPDGQGQIGRMAVRADLRRQSVGGQLLLFLEEEARAMGLRRVLLHAQSYVEAFYREHGYREEGVPFMEAGIQHILMRKTLL